MLRIIVLGGALLLAACSSSGGSGDGQEDERQRCSAASECRVPTPLCDGGFCVACTDTAHCTADRPFCIDGACRGGECSDGADCSAERPLCNAGICAACAANDHCEGDEVCRADGSCGACTDHWQCGDGLACVEGACGAPPKLPGLLVVLDKSKSMDICASGVPGEGRCDSDGDGNLDETGASRWEVIRSVLAGPASSVGIADFGLVVTNMGGDDPACGDASVEVAAGSSAEAFAEAWTRPALAQPTPGGTPVAAALEVANRELAGSSETRVVLITDGQPNCNIDHPMPCICANESGCPEVGGGLAAAGTEGHFVDGRFCLDQDASVAAVEALRAASFRTAVVAVGLHGDSLGTLGAMAAAGGLASAAADGVHYVGSPDALIEAIERILYAD